ASRNLAVQRRILEQFPSQAVVRPGAASYVAKKRGRGQRPRGERRTQEALQRTALKGSVLRKVDSGEELPEEEKIFYHEWVRELLDHAPKDLRREAIEHCERNDAPRVRASALFRVLK
ncbi:unnamed protein product, partial [Prorocentrum cordatum]